MDSILFLLDTKLEEGKIQSHLPHVLKILKKADDTDPMCTHPTPPPMKRLIQCPDCRNTDKWYMLKDELTGDLVCLGAEGQGCGYVLTELMLEVMSKQQQQSEDLNPQYYSKQSQFRSYMTGGSCELRKTNEIVERMLTSMNSTNQTTSDYFKDKQRTRVYEMIDDVSRLSGVVPPEECDEVKQLFNCYREKITRIHKLPLVLACLFYIVRNNINY
mmetsp:Transcript_22913/g.28797  ORF Transcript_22913/g.28797 Transcript_22913/m.28797 type:complete len:216 (+) Transcript_22913:166-813(+)